MTFNEHLANALKLARRENAITINRVRGMGVFAFTVTAGANAFLWGDVSWLPTFTWLLAYLAIALTLMLGGSRSPLILKASLVGIPVFDIPMVTLVQFATMTGSSNPAQISEFSLSLFVCMMMLSALTLRPLQLYLSLTVAIGAQQFLQYQAGISLGGHIVSALVLIIATWICHGAGRKRIDLVSRVSKTDARRRRLQRYFSPGVGELIEKHEEGRLAKGTDCELTVVFMDIRGFTAMSETMDSHEVVSVLNTFHGQMVEALFRHAGTLDKYTGDGLLAYFNAPVGQPDHAERAIRCAIEMQQVLSSMNSGSLKERPLEMGIGIHTGRAVVGDIGAPHRREFTAIGDAVNVAARVEQLTKEIDADILVTEATAALVPDDLPLMEVGEFPIRGRTEPIRLFKST